MEETKFVAVASGSLIREEDRSPNSTNNLKPEVKNGPIHTTHMVFRHPYTSPDIHFAS